MGLFIIAVIVLLICVCVSRIGSLDLREVAVAHTTVVKNYYLTAWLHQCRRNWILSEVKRMRVHLELEYIKSNCFTKSY